MTVQEILEAAREHADRCNEDIKYASTRVDHIRTTARAIEAAHLVDYLEGLTTEAL